MEMSCETWLIFTDFVGQELGPYAMWQHHHTYAAAGRGGEEGTVCSDVVRCEHVAAVQADIRNFLCMYKLPLHPVGDLAHVWVSCSAGAAMWMRVMAPCRFLMMLSAQVKAELRRIFAFRCDDICQSCLK